MNLDPKQRKVPQIPPKGQRLRTLIDSDAKNEIDDRRPGSDGYCPGAALAGAF